MAPPQSLHYHFYGYLLRPRPERLHYNDIAAWVSKSVGDPVTAERLDALNPSYFSSAEDLREAILDTLEEPVSSGSFNGWVRARTRFFFLTSITLVFNTGLSARDPIDLAQKLSQCPPAALSTTSLTQG